MSKKTDNLLGDRFLIRGTSLLIQCPAEICDSISAQQNIEWSLGRESFRIKPAQPLKTLWLRARNGNESELTQRVRAMERGLHLNAPQREQVERNVIRAESKKSGAPLLMQLRSLVEQHRPDIVRLSPIDALIGDDDARAFCDGLDPILSEFRCGAIVLQIKLENAETP
jgi:hypothetical protein